ncbi:MAG: hypothetical protein HYT77_07765 [Deltaproteobacteria bacterium]|nr:hypothetical protein [Deltaproteobacteria bacterium]
MKCEPSALLVEEEPNLQAYRFSDIGVGQGVRMIGDHLYIYGQSETGGIVQELDSNLKPTGWIGSLNYQGFPLVAKPVSIAYHEGKPTFIGATSHKRKAVLYQIDWSLFYEDKNLDRALLRTIEDPESGEATRPEYVLYGDQWYLATTGYDREKTEIRLMDPERLTEVDSTTEVGVIRYRIEGDPYIQNLFWSESESQLVLVQNIGYVKGWRLTSLDLQKAVEGGVAPIVKTRCFPDQSELEGYSRLSDTREVFLTSSLKENLFVSPSP